MEKVVTSCKLNYLWSINQTALRILSLLHNAYTIHSQSKKKIEKQAI